MALALIIGCGGFVGSVARYLLSGAVQRAAANTWFPLGTLAVNILGCVAIGILAGLAESRGILGPQSRAFLLIGVLGGFTTFSSFSYDTASLIQNGQYPSAAANVLLQVVVGIAATMVSYSLMQRA